MEDLEEGEIVVVVKRTGMGSSWSFACTYCFERVGMEVSEWLIEDRQGVHAIHILLLLFFSASISINNGTQNEANALGSNWRHLH